MGSTSATKTAARLHPARRGAAAHAAGPRESRALPQRLDSPPDRLRSARQALNIRDLERRSLDQRSQSMQRREFLMTAAAAAGIARTGWAQGAGQKAEAVHARSHRDHDAELQPDAEGPRRGARTEPDARAVRPAQDAGRHVRGAQDRIPALPHRIHRALVLEGASRPHRESQVANDADQRRVRRRAHLLGADGPLPDDDGRSDQALGRSRRDAGRSAGHGQSGPADPREQGPRDPGTQADGRLRQVQEHHRLGRDRAVAGAVVEAELALAGAAGAAPATPPPAPPPPPPGTPANSRERWMLLAEIIKAAGAYSNVDVGGARGAESAGAPRLPEGHDAVHRRHACTRAST